MKFLPTFFEVAVHVSAIPVRMTYSLLRRLDPVSTESAYRTVVYQ